MACGWSPAGSNSEWTTKGDPGYRNCFMADPVRDHLSLLSLPCLIVVKAFKAGTGQGQDPRPGIHQGPVRKPGDLHECTTTGKGRKPRSLSFHPGGDNFGRQTGPDSGDQLQASQRIRPQVHRHPRLVTRALVQQFQIRIAVGPKGPHHESMQPEKDQPEENRSDLPLASLIRIANQLVAFRGRIPDQRGTRFPGPR